MKLLRDEIGVRYASKSTSSIHSFFFLLRPSYFTVLIHAVVFSESCSLSARSRSPHGVSSLFHSSCCIYFYFSFASFFPLFSLFLIFFFCSFSCFVWLFFFLPSCLSPLSFYFLLFFFYFSVIITVITVASRWYTTTSLRTPDFLKTLCKTFFNLLTVLTNTVNLTVFGQLTKLVKFGQFDQTKFGQIDLTKQSLMYMKKIFTL